MIIEGGVSGEKNLSTKEKTKKQGAWLQKKIEDQIR
jgi:hypothetical protein